MALSKTISKSDLAEGQTAAAASKLKKFAWRLFWEGTPFAVNGVSKRRWRIRWNKLWEYSRGLGHVPWQKGWKVLDFGGGATLPVYFLADAGLDVASYDIDAGLTGQAREVGAAHGWPLLATTQDLTESLPDPIPSLDWVISFCVIEHLPKEKQRLIVSRMASWLKPGGYFTLTFDYSPEAPVSGAIRNEAEVRELVEASGLEYVDGQAFHDCGERFVLDKKYPEAKFTFGSLFLRKP